MSDLRLADPTPTPDQESPTTWIVSVSYTHLTLPTICSV